MKILNLYAGTGGNRKLWGDEHEITAVEINPDIAKIYGDFFPNDTIVVGDAHQYLLDHFQEFDFIWSSPPCPSHSRMRMLWKGDGKNIKGKSSGASFKYPDMALYEEILFLTHFFKGKWCVENVISYYKPLIRPSECCNHYFWSNFFIKPIENIKRGFRDDQQVEKQKRMGFDLSKYNTSWRFKRDIIKNCIEPELGLFILNQVQNTEQQTLFSQSRD